MNAIGRQARANLLSRPLQTALVFLSLVAASTVFSVGLLTLMNINRPFERAFESTAGAHIWIDLQGGEISPTEAAKRLAGLPGVLANTGPRQTATVTAYFGNGHEELKLEALGDTMPEVAHPVITAGRFFLPGDLDVLLLDQNLAREKNLQVGDSIRLLSPAGEKTFSIIGLVLSTESGPYPTWKPATNYVRESSFLALTEEQSRSVRVGLRLDDPESAAETWKLARAALGTAARDYSDWRTVRDSVGELTIFQTIFFIAFGVFALLAAGLIVIATISGAVLGQYRSIGILRAIGFTGGQIIGVYVLENFFLGLIAAGIGLAVGIAAAPKVLEPIAASLGVPPAEDVPPGVILAVLLAIPVLAAIFSWIPARNGARINLIRAIRTGSEQPRVESSAPARLAARMRLPVVWRLGLKDLISRPQRAALLVGSIALGIFGVVYGMGAGATMARYLNDPAFNGTPFRLLFRRGSLADPEAKSFLEAQPGIPSFYGDQTLKLYVPAMEETISAHFLDGDLDASDFGISEGRMFSSPGEAVAGKGLLRWAGVSIGDDLEIQVEGRTMRLRIVGAYTEMRNRGRVILSSMETLRQALPSAEPSLYFAKAASGADPQEVVNSTEHASGGRLLGDVVDSSPPAAIRQLPSIIGALAAFLNLIVWIGVFNAAFMNMRERTRELGVLKAVGVTPVQIVAAVCIGMGVYVVLASLIALPLGVLATYLVLTNMAKWFGFTRAIPFAVNGLGLALVPLGAFALTWAGSMLPALRAAKIKVAEALRYE